MNYFEKMSYYVTSIEYNAEAQAENRSVPKMFTSRDKAVACYHKTIADNMNNAKLSWSIVKLWNSTGVDEMVDCWHREVEETTETE